MPELAIGAAVAPGFNAFDIPDFDTGVVGAVLSYVYMTLKS